MDKNNILALISVIRDKANKFLIYEMSMRGIEGLAPSHGSIFAALFMESKLTMKDLSQRIKKDKSTVTVLVDKLVKLGYVEKTRDLIDTRVVYVTLTERGKELRPELQEISHKLISKVYKDISEEEQELVVSILSKIKNNF